MNRLLTSAGAFAAVMVMTATVASAAQAPDAAVRANPAPVASFNGGLVSKTAPAAEKSIIVAQRRGGRRGGRRVGKGAVAAGIALGILGAAAAASAAQSQPYYRDRRYRDRDWEHRRWCRRMERRCDDGSRWACRKFYRSC